MTEITTANPSDEKPKKDYGFQQFRKRREKEASDLTAKLARSIPRERARILDEIVNIMKYAKGNIEKTETNPPTGQNYISPPLLIRRAYERIQKLLEQNKYL